MNRLKLTFALLILAGSFFLNGCILNASEQLPSETGEIETDKNSTYHPLDVSATSTMDRGAPETWPRFEFKELGFSIKLPFNRQEISYGFHDCSKLEDRCDNIASYWYGGSIHGIRGINYRFMGSFSKNYTYPSEGDLTAFYDLEKGDNSYFVVFPQSKRLAIHPIRILRLEAGEAVIFDAGKDYYAQDDFSNEWYKQNSGQRYAAAIKLKDNSKFQAVIFEFDENDLPLPEFVESLKNIKKLSS